MKRTQATIVVLLSLSVTSCGGGTGAGGTFGSSETLTCEGWETYRGALEAQDYDAAERLFSDALNLDPAFSEAHNGLGWPDGA